ncbi:GNAT family N-acetyltransferase [Sporosarcina sp. Te-1]|uniref:GNAT family N-acetyltransferase n=1 Tax=Sporosarcina sp. Te-1 TaxID=2818390 RepID=UPI001A9E3C82|nr:GNAT family N-acetyltransferase [Sporosarcina sp. Te-1]QTD42986.1 GNAT family N-acetyltransferase [Sporosarcina sp. Te-1]
MMEFREVTWENFEECIHLELKKEQKNFMASNMYSLAQSYVALLNDDLPAMTFAIYAEEKMVGFIMMYYDTAEENEFGDEACYGILRFMIDRRYQGKGYGKAALAKALEYIKTYPQGEAASVYISYEPTNDNAKNLYKSFRFYETGQEIEGETVIKKDL